MKTTLEELQAFVAVVDGGSITAAAETLGQTVSGISRALARLEKKLDTTLLRRTTRRTELTEEGQAFLQRTRAILASIDEARADAERGLDAPFKHRDALHAARASLDSIDQAAQRFLGARLLYGGAIPRDERVASAERHGAPLLVRHPHSGYAVAVERIASALLQEQTAAGELQRAA